MQCRRRTGSSGELDVFGATGYFAAAAGLADRASSVMEPPDQLIQQVKVTMTVHDKRMEESFRCLRGHQQLIGVQEQHHDAGQLGVAKPGGKSKLAALFDFVVPSSPRASFRKELPPPPPTSRMAADEPAKVSSSTSRGSSDDAGSVSAASGSMQSQGCGFGLDLGVATGDRRLQGVRVVRSSGDEERWVVRCSAWEEKQQHEKMLDAASTDHHDHQGTGEGDQDGIPPGNWDSDSSSDLFDLDLEYMC